MPAWLNGALRAVLQGPCALESGPEQEQTRSPD